MIENGYSTFKILRLMVLCYLAIDNPKNTFNCQCLEQSVHAKSLQSCLTLCYTVDCSPPRSSVHGILQQEHWSGLPCPPSGHLPNLGIKPLQVDSLPLSHHRNPSKYLHVSNYYFSEHRTWRNHSVKSQFLVNSFPGH